MRRIDVQIFLANLASFLLMGLHKFDAAPMGLETLHLAYAIGCKLV